MRTRVSLDIVGRPSPYNQALLPNAHVRGGEWGARPPLVREGHLSADALQIGSPLSSWAASTGHGCVTTHHAPRRVALAVRTPSFTSTKRCKRLLEPIAMRHRSAMAFCFGISPTLFRIVWTIHSVDPTLAKTVMIDDTYGDLLTGALPQYRPAATWARGEACAAGGCLVDPDPKLVGNGTWHEAVGTADNSPPRTIDLSFTGTPSH